jgi:hypothetical protein
MKVGGQLVPQGQKAVVPPGESVKVTVEWRPLNVFGKFGKTLSFPTNDPSNRTLELSIQGNVVGHWRLMPNSIGFYGLGTDETRTVTSNLLIYKDEKWQILGQTWNGKVGTEHIGVIYDEIPANELAKMDPPPKSGYKLSFTARKGMPAGVFSETVTLNTTPKTSTPVTLNVQGDVLASVGLLRTTPHLQGNNELHLGQSLPQGKVHHVDLTIRVAGSHRKDTRFSVKKVVPEDLKVSIGEPKNVNDPVVFVPLKVELPATAKPQAWLSTKPEEMGQIVIETTNPDVKELKLFVRFAIVDPAAAPVVPANPKKK